MASVDITRIAGNMQALNSLNALNGINKRLAMHQARLATGKRILEAADDPAGMSLATTFNVRRQGMKTALGAIGDAKNLLATQEGGLSKIQDILVKMRNKALESTGDTIGVEEKSAIFGQMKAFRDEINDIVSDTSWNGQALLGGDNAQSLDLDFLVNSDGGTATFGFDTVAGGIDANQTFHSASAAGAAAIPANITSATDTLDDTVIAAGGVAISAVDASQTELIDGETYEVTYTHATTEFKLNVKGGADVLISDVIGGAGTPDVGGHTLAGSEVWNTGAGVTITFGDLSSGADGVYEFTYNAEVASTLPDYDLGLNDTALNVSADASVSLAAIDAAQKIVQQAISQVGAFSARMTFKEEALTVAHANTEAAYNRIMNANMAEEQVEASKLLILQQTSTAMLSQANAAPQFVLSLFR